MISTPQQRGKMTKINVPITWGGSDDSETLNDVLDKMKKIAPSMTATRLENVTSGGWPVYTIEYGKNDEGVVKEYLGYADS
jgi:hypothetical protein